MADMARYPAHGPRVPGIAGSRAIGVLAIWAGRAGWAGRSVRPAGRCMRGQRRRL